MTSDEQHDELGKCYRRRFRKYIWNGVYEDAIGGPVGTRPFARIMLERVRRGDMILVTKTSRLFCTTTETLAWLKELHSRGVGFYSIRDGLDLTDQAVMAEWLRVVYQWLALTRKFGSGGDGLLPHGMRTRKGDRVPYRRDIWVMRFCYEHGQGPGDGHANDSRIANFLNQWGMRYRKSPLFPRLVRRLREAYWQYERMRQAVRDRELLLKELPREFAAMAKHPMFREPLWKDYHGLPREAKQGKFR